MSEENVHEELLQNTRAEVDRARAVGYNCPYRLHAIGPIYCCRVSDLAKEFRCPKLALETFSFPKDAVLTSEDVEEYVKRYSEVVRDIAKTLAEPHVAKMNICTYVPVDSKEEGE